MRTTLNIDDDLLERAQAVTNITSNSKLVEKALKALIERESARRLAELGSSVPEIKDIPRRRFVENPD